MNTRRAGKQNQTTLKFQLYTFGKSSITNYYCTWVFIGVFVKKNYKRKKKVLWTNLEHHYDTRRVGTVDHRYKLLPHLCWRCEVLEIVKRCVQISREQIYSLSCAVDLWSACCWVPAQPTGHWVENHKCLGQSSFQRFHREEILYAGRRVDIDCRSVDARSYQVEFRKPDFCALGFFLMG